MISSTADGASVNFGRYSGLVTRQKSNRKWLVTIHCVSHRAELSIKDSIYKNHFFKEIDEFMIGLFAFFKNSGKLKRMVQNSAKLHGIQYYIIPKISGTRFITHRLRGVDSLLHNWTALREAFENAVVDDKTKGETKAKLRGYLKKLNDYRYRCTATAYKSILRCCAKLILEFEKEDILVSEVNAHVEDTIEELSGVLENTPENIEVLGNCLIKQEVSYNFIKLK